MRDRLAHHFGVECALSRLVGDDLREVVVHAQEVYGSADLVQVAGANIRPGFAEPDQGFGWILALEYRVHEQAVVVGVGPDSAGAILLGIGGGLLWMQVQRDSDLAACT